MHKIIKKAIAFAMIGMLCLNAHSFAADVSDLEEQKEEQEQKKDEAQAVVDQLKNEQNDIMSAISELDEKVQQYSSQIIDIKGQKAELEEEIETLEEELSEAKKQESAQLEAMKSRIQYAYENNDVDYINTIFSTTDISDIANQQEYVEQVYNYDTNQLNALMSIRKTIANKELLIQTNLTALQDLETQVSENQQAVEMLMNGKKEQVGGYSSSIDDYEAKVAEYEAGIEEVSSQIKAAEEAAEAARKAKIKKLKEQARKKKLEQMRQEQAESGEDVASDSDAVEIDEEEIDKMFVDTTPTSLQWPVSTGGVITSEFGPRWGSNHNGLDIGCDMYTPIVAAESGTVLISEYESSCGNYVIIDHGGGMTTVYMHNSELLVSVGEEVARGQVIAYSGSTGWSTGPHCHIGVRVDGEYVDPLPYLTN